MNHDNEPKDSAFRLATLSRESNVTKGAAGTAAWEHETSKRNQPQPGGLYEEVLSVTTIPCNPDKSSVESMAGDIKAAVEVKTGLPLDSFCI
ncbi:hypothetical protein ABBQ38_013653 [Trebouxia sp. C0009 RCD-2024]